ILSGAMNVLILQCCVFFFFVSVYTRTCRNNASISNFGVVSNRKTNLFSTKSIFLLYGCNSKTNHCEYLKFSPNVYVIIIFTKSVENVKICNISRRYLKISPFLIIQILTKILAKS
ncbi:hypothetical protein FWK35_00031852, partial [Aphis craccivora]